MKKILLTALLLTSPALAAPAPPGEPKINEPLAGLITLDKDLQASRVTKKQAVKLDDFREELQLSTNGHEVEMDKIPLAPEETEAPAAQ